MHTKPLSRTATRSISIPAPPVAVLDVVGDAWRLPEWAPDFARSVRPEGDGWQVDTGEGELFIYLRVSRELGTVDLLRPGVPPFGAFSRVLHNGDGSEYQFTLFFPDGTEDAAIDRQMEMVEEELRTVRALCEVDGALEA